MPKALMDPLEERPATRTEDHPHEYAEFEGVIPVGQYGVGTVIVRRTGRTTANSIPPDKQLAIVRLERWLSFHLFGTGGRVSLD
jgi:bifunctional non-homologous end joining protein LigD